MRHLGKNVVIVVALVAAGFLAAWLRFRPYLGSESRYTDGAVTYDVTEPGAVRYAVWEQPRPLGRHRCNAHAALLRGSPFPIAASIATTRSGSVAVRISARSAGALRAPADARASRYHPRCFRAARIPSDRG